jgi:NDP-sugar pyrophosphorylase family protein
MLVGAILAVGQSSSEHDGRCGPWGRATEPGMLAGTPIACVELLGQSVLDRTVQKLRSDGVKPVTVVVKDEFSHLARTSTAEGATVNSVPPQTDLWSATECVLREYVQHGVELILLSRLGAYVDLDLGHLIRFHRDTKQGMTVLTKEYEPLDSWIIEAGEVRKLQRLGLPRLMDREGLPSVTPYCVPGHACRLEEVSDLRRLVVDTFLSRGSIRPRGHEVKAGVWFGEGAQVHRRARIVAPAYLGRGAKLRADTLVTQCSALERDCDVREGTVIEDASILANTCVGKGLNVTHAVVDGNKLFPVGQQLMVEIHDPKLLGRTTAAESPSSVADGIASSSLAERLLATAWN